MNILSDLFGQKMFTNTSLRLLWYFISQKEICLGSMIVKSIGRILRDLFEKKSKIPEKVI